MINKFTLVYPETVDPTTVNATFDLKVMSLTYGFYCALS
jgi:hypothetical protein